MITVLLLSDQAIEQRIQYIEEHYIDLAHLLVFPLIFAFGFAVLMPWLTWGIQWTSGYAILERRKHKLKCDTDYLLASVERAEAQASVNLVLAQDEQSRRQKQELEDKRKRIASQQEAATADIRKAEIKLETRQKEIEQQNRKSTELERREIERLNEQLGKLREQARREQEQALLEIKRRESELEKQLREMSTSSILRSDVDFETVLTRKTYRLFHNPKVGPERSKLVTFESDGSIGKGKNSNESAWRIEEGKLEILQADDKVHSRFYFLPPSRIFVHTGDSDTPSARGQYLIPEK